MSTPPPCSSVRRRLFALAIAAPLLPFVRAAEAAPSRRDRELAAVIADHVRTRHFDITIGARIAAALEREVAAGALEGAGTPTERAERLTRLLRLFSGDRHFRVLPEPGPEQAQAPPDTPADGISRASVGADGIGQLALTHFAPDGSTQRAAWARTFATLAPARALLIDVRDNRGGDPASVSALLGYLFDGQPFTSMRFLARGVEVRTSIVRPVPAPLGFGGRRPVAVLISGRTFSGGEALAYELQAWGRARVFGEPSGGAAHPTLLLELPQGLALSVPWLRPVHVRTGANWEGAGVQPDVSTSAAQAPAAALRWLRSAASS